MNSCLGGDEVLKNMCETVMFEDVNVETGGGCHHSQEVRERGQKWYPGWPRQVLLKTEKITSWFVLHQSMTRSIVMSSHSHKMNLVCRDGTESPNILYNIYRTGLTRQHLKSSVFYYVYVLSPYRPHRALLLQLVHIGHPADTVAAHEYWNNNS